MRKVLSISEIVEDLDRETEPRELCATAEADYDEARREMHMQLDAFVRHVHHARADESTRPAWLPKPQTLREDVSDAEASDLARDIFRRWARKVRDAATHRGQAG